MTRFRAHTWPALFHALIGRSTTSNGEGEEIAFLSEGMCSYGILSGRHEADIISRSICSRGSTGKLQDVHLQLFLYRHTFGVSPLSDQHA